MKQLHLEIDRRHAGYIPPALNRTLKRAAQCGTLDQAESLVRAAAPRSGSARTARRWRSRTSDGPRPTKMETLGALTPSLRRPALPTLESAPARPSRRAQGACART